MQSLAISLRPKTFDEVIGQESVVASLRSKMDNPPTAILFCGETGTGKTTLASLVARAVQGDDPNEDMWDIQVKNAASENGVAVARQLCEDTRYSTTHGKYRVIILEEAHMMTNEAQNTLLIPIEKPDSNTIWIFCTTEPEEIIGALRSRFMVYELKPLDKSGIFILLGRAAYPEREFPNDFYEEVIKIGLTNTREILYSYEKYISGVPLAEALIPPPDQNPLYTDIAKYAVKGDWNRTRELLQKTKVADSKGLKSVVCGFLRSNLINNYRPEANDAISEALIRIGNLNAFESGVDYSALVGILYNYAKKVRK